ncbi:MAG: response regulator transcription factor [bacterium]
MVENKKILIADDSATFRSSFVRILKNLPFAGEVVEAKDGESAIQSARQHLPDLIFMDITMPGLSGIEATRRILGEFPETKIVMVTVHANRALLKESLEAGASGYLIKKDIYMELAPAVEKIMNNEQFISEEIRDL